MFTSLPFRVQRRPHPNFLGDTSSRTCFLPFSATLLNAAVVQLVEALKYAFCCSIYRVKEHLLSWDDGTSTWTVWVFLAKTRVPENMNCGVVRLSQNGAKDHFVFRHLGLMGAALAHRQFVYIFIFTLFHKAEGSGVLYKTNFQMTLFYLLLLFMTYVEWVSSVWTAAVMMANIDIFYLWIWNLESDFLHSDLWLLQANTFQIVISWNEEHWLIHKCLKEKAADIPFVPINKSSGKTTTCDEMIPLTRVLSV